MRCIMWMKAVVERSLQSCWCDPYYPLVPIRSTCLEGVLQFHVVFSSSCVPVGRTGCTILGGLVSRGILTVFGTGSIAWKFSRDRGVLGGLDSSCQDLPWDRLVQNVDDRSACLMATWAVLRSFTFPLFFHLLSLAVGSCWGFLISSQVIWVYHLIKLCIISFRREAKYPARRRIGLVTLDVIDLCLMLTNQNQNSNLWQRLSTPQDPMRRLPS